MLYMESKVHILLRRGVIPLLQAALRFVEDIKEQKCITEQALRTTSIDFVVGRKDWAVIDNIARPRTLTPTSVTLKVELGLRNPPISPAHREC